MKELLKNYAVGLLALGVLGLLACLLGLLFEYPWLALIVLGLVGVPTLGHFLRYSVKAHDSFGAPDGL